MAVHHRLLSTLGLWSIGSIAGGGWMWRSGARPATRLFGRQTLAWGVIDLAIAGYGLSRPAPEAHRLRKVLLANAVADVGYIAGGAFLVGRGGRLRPDGAAVIVQGAFLLALDTHFANSLHRESAETP